MHTIITIGRQYGSGGREVGQKLAAHYGINFYDNELLAKVAKESGFCQEIVQQQDERPTNSFLYNLVMDTYSFGFSNSAFSDMPISQKVFLAQYDTIKKIAVRSSPHTGFSLPVHDDRLSVVDPGRHFYGHRPFFARASGTAAAGTFFLDHLAGTAAGRTGPDCGHPAAALTDLA